MYALDSPEWENEVLESFAALRCVCNPPLLFVSQVEMTFELLMSDLDQNRMRELFYCDSPDKEQLRLRGEHCTRASGIGDLLKGVQVPTALGFFLSLLTVFVQVDASMFYPMGYSMNGVLDRNYYTIHVTPQPHISYGEPNLFACCVAGVC